MLLTRLKSCLLTIFSHLLILEAFYASVESFYLVSVLTDATVLESLLSLNSFVPRCIFCTLILFLLFILQIVCPITINELSSNLAGQKLGKASHNIMITSAFVVCLGIF